MPQRIAFALLTVSSLAMTVRTCVARDAVTLLSDLYGRGVHAYFSAQYDQARQYFDAAIAHGSRDPRCYYFRGLARLQTGQRDAADQDFRKGAMVEYSSEANYDIGRSLERIQGGTRMRLEQIRRDTQLAALVRRPRGRQPTLAGQPPSRIEAPSERVRQAATAAGDQLPPDAADPFAGDVSGPIGAQKIETATPPEPDRPEAPPLAADNVPDPFGESDAPADAPLAAPATAAAAHDPLGSRPDASSPPSRPGSLRSLMRAVTRVIPGATPQNGQAAATPPGGPPLGAGGMRQAAPPPPADDPFAAGPNLEDPFAESPQPKAAPIAPADQPPQQKVPPPPGPDSDPFGQPAQPSADPFDAPQPADEDPFGQAPATEDNKQGDANDTPEDAEPSADQADPFADDPS